jgi:hypothetical protein
MRRARPVRSVRYNFADSDNAHNGGPGPFSPYLHWASALSASVRLDWHYDNNSTGGDSCCPETFAAASGYSSSGAPLAPCEEASIQCLR